MSAHSPLNQSVQKTEEWLHDLARRLGTDDLSVAYHALRAGLHAVRDRLTTDEAAQLSAQLPLVVRGIYFEGWDPRRRPPHTHRPAFLEAIAEEMAPKNAVDAETVARAFFGLIADRVTAGEIEDVRGMLPADLRALWA